MADVTWAMIESLDSSFAAVDADRQQDIVDLVNNLSSTHLGGDDGVRYKMARLYRGAHEAMMQLAKGNVGSGLVTQETVTATSIETRYSEGHGEESLRSTSWGALYLGIVETSTSRLLRTWR